MLKLLAGAPSGRPAGDADRGRRGRQDAAGAGGRRRGAAGRLPDGVWLVELAALADPALVPAAVAAVARRARAAGARPDRDAGGRAARAGGCCWCSTTASTCVDACAELAEALLAACPGLRILATSRERCGLPGELAWRVPPLATARAGGRPSRAGDAEPRRCGCSSSGRAGGGRLRADADERRRRSAADLPAAGRPAAGDRAGGGAGCACSPAEQLAARLDDSLALLTDGGRRRRRASRRCGRRWTGATPCWPSRSERLFRRLAVFAGGWTLEAAEAVCAGDGWQRAEAVPLDLLARLVDKSLVRWSERARGDGALPAAGDGAPVRRRAAGRGRARRAAARPACRLLSGAGRGGGAAAGRDGAGRLVGPAGGRARQPARGDAKGALQLGAALVQFWESRGHLAEGRGRLAAALALGDGASSMSRARALTAAGKLAWYQCEYAPSRRLLAESLRLLETLDAPAERARAPATSWACWRPRRAIWPRRGGRSTIA